jgi:hypothetical protein
MKISEILEAKDWTKDVKISDSDKRLMQTEFKKSNDYIRFTNNQISLQITVQTPYLKNKLEAQIWLITKNTMEEWLLTRKTRGPTRFGKHKSLNHVVSLIKKLSKYEA